MKNMHFEEHFTGIIFIELSGNQLQRFINICYHRGIDMNDLVLGQKVAHFYTTANHMELLEELGKRYQTKVSVKTKRGLPFLLQKMLYRRGFLLGLILCYAFLIYMSGCVWEIRFNGNRYHTDDSLKSYLSDVGIRYGFRMNKINAEELELNIRKQYSDVAWCSVQKDGCRLTITITESNINSEQGDTLQNPLEGVAIVAERDAIISHLVTQEGEALVTIGQSVKAGEVLINGYITYTDDYNYITGYKAVCAQADIRAIWEIPFEMSVSLIQNTSECFLTEYKQMRHLDKIFPYFYFEKKTVFPSMAEEKVPYQEALVKLENKFYQQLKKWQENGYEVIEKNLNIEDNNREVLYVGTILLEGPFGVCSPCEIPSISEGLDEFDGD